MPSKEAPLQGDILTRGFVDTKSGEQVPLQRDMFTGELVDVRTPKQKRRDKQREGPQQAAMFSQRELAQFGVRANPKMPLSTKTRLELAMEDPRTEEEIERDRKKAAQALTYPMFGDDHDGSTPRIGRQTPDALEEEEIETMRFPSGTKLPVIHPQEPDGEVLIHLIGDVVIPLWSTRDEVYEWILSEHKSYGYRAYLLGANQLEIWGRDQSGFFLVTYSEMEMLENVEWVNQTDR
jgi:hypothetical protein